MLIIVSPRQVLFTLKLYVVADTLAQWYFQPMGNTNPALAPSTRRGLKNGLTSSFGSICFAGLILAIIDILRQAMNNAQQNAEVCEGLVKDLQRLEAGDSVPIIHKKTPEENSHKFAQNLT